MPLNQHILHPRLPWHLRHLFFPQRATVYTLNETTGTFTAIIHTQLHCRLVALDRSASTAEPSGRSALLAMRSFEWEGTYQLPEQGVQLDVEGVRWTPVAGTYGAIGVWNNGPQYRRCDVIREES